jgi:hypothetical protein
MTGPSGKTLYWWVGGALATAWYLLQSKTIDDTIQAATMGTNDSTDPGSTTINARLTPYYPYKKYANPAEARMEGGPKDAATKPLNTLGQFQRGEADYVSVSGDLTVWPYGQRISIDAWPDVTFRVVDTGSHFTDSPLIKGAAKVYRLAGYEPLDIAQDYPPPNYPTTAVVTIFPGDNWASQKPGFTQNLDYTNIQGQTPQTQQTSVGEGYDEFSGDGNV